MLIVGLAVVLGVGYGAYLLIDSRLHQDERRATVETFTRAWAAGDHDAMYRLLDEDSRRAHPRASFLAAYRRADRGAGVKNVTVGAAGPLLSGGYVNVPVNVQTRDFGTLRGTIRFHAVQTGDVARVSWE
ncbi:MAG TPA: NTF2-like N-terminal transpeptidase domain-containing protein, partial [Solirubrobacter sp.]|nr:NTF2-like N-terminal transpeptidase domain-containing protein [Solirubrobacter sp.]